MSQPVKATYFDGKSAKPHSVELVLEAAVLRIRQPGGTGFFWPIDELEPEQTASGRYRVHRAGDPGAHVEFNDNTLAQQLLDHPQISKVRGKTDRRTQFKIIGWSLAAAVSLIWLFFFGVPMFADRLAPLVPVAIEARLGEQVEEYLVDYLDIKEVCTEPAEGLAALNQMATRLTKGEVLLFPLKIKVAKNATANAFAAPGGRLVIYSGLIDQAENPDELAGILGHEIGHVHNRDSMRMVLGALGTSGLASLVLGDFTGSIVVITAVQFLQQASYSREVERQADEFAVRVMTKAGRSSAPMADLMQRIVGKDDAAEWLGAFSSHPVTKDRLAFFRSAKPPPQSGPPLVTDQQWRRIKELCK